MDFLKRLWKEEEGQGLVEYGVLVLLIVVVVIVAVNLFDEEIAGLFGRVGDAIDGAGLD